MPSKKKVTGSLSKLLRNRKSTSVVLGVCLAIAASTYVATAKFSADTVTGSWQIVDNKYVTYTTQVVDGNGKGIEGLEVSYQPDHLMRSGDKTYYTADSISEGKTDKDGFVKDRFQICSNGSQSMACVGAGMIGRVKITVSKDGKKVSTNQYFLGKTIKDTKITITIRDVNKTASSASKSSSSWAITDQKIKYTVKVVDQKGKPVSGSAVTLAGTSGVNIKDNAKGNNINSSMGSTDSNGLVSSNEFNVCKKGNSTKSCYKSGDSVFFIGKLTPNAWKDGKQITKNTSSFSSSNIKDKTITIRIKSATTASKSTTTTSGTKIGGVVLTSTNKTIGMSVHVIDKKTKSGVSGIKVSYDRKRIYINNKTSWNGDYSEGSTSTTNGFIGNQDFSEIYDICKGSNGWYYACVAGMAIERRLALKFIIGDDASSSRNKFVLYNIPQPLAKSEAELNKKFKAYKDKSDLFFPTVYLYSDGSGGYVGKTWDKANKNGTIKTDTSPSGSKVTATAKTATSKVASAVKTGTSKVKKVVTGANKTAKVSTTPTSKDKAVFSEALPPGNVNMTKNLVFQLKDKDSRELSSDPVIITVAYKVCTANGCGGGSGEDFTKETFTAFKKNGMYKMSFGVTNVPEVKKSGSKTITTNRYFLFYGDGTHLVRHLYISNIKGEFIKEVPIGSYPFATKTEAAAKKFQLKTYIYDKVVSASSPAATVSPSTSSSNETEVNFGAPVVESPSSSASTGTASSSSAKPTSTLPNDLYSSTSSNNSWLGTWWQSVFTF